MLAKSHNLKVPGAICHPGNTATRGFFFQPGHEMRHNFSKGWRLVHICLGMFFCEESWHPYQDRGDWHLPCMCTECRIKVLVYKQNINLYKYIKYIMGSPCWYTYLLLHPFKKVWICDWTFHVTFQLVSCHQKSLSFLPDWFRSTWHEATQACHLGNMVCMTFRLGWYRVTSTERCSNFESNYVHTSSLKSLRSCGQSLQIFLKSNEWTTLKYVSGKYPSHHPQQFGPLTCPWCPSCPPPTKSG